MKNNATLKVGDMVMISGKLFTGRDAVHKYLHEEENLLKLKNQIIYHCGYIVLEKAGKYEVMAAGFPTLVFVRALSVGSDA